MYGSVMKYFPDKGFGFIRGEDNNSYFVHCSNLNGENLERGYYVAFKPYQNDRSDYNAKDVFVIESAECYERTREKQPLPKHLRKGSKYKSKSKPYNTDRLQKNDKAFERFVKKFMSEKKAADTI